jgi:hypothetical protein
MDPEALRWRKIPWKKVPQDSRADVLPFLSVQDNVELNIALLIDEECRDDPTSCLTRTRRVYRPMTTQCTRTLTTSKACAGC